MRHKIAKYGKSFANYLSAIILNPWILYDLDKLTGGQRIC